MFSKYSSNPDLKEIISEVINNKNQVVKGHSDSINCLINCVDYKFILQVIQNPNNGKNNSFFIIEKDEFYTPLFFYDYPSNEIIDLIEKKSDAKKLFISSKKIKSEEEIVDNYKQDKKTKILLFYHLKFPLSNANSENNVNRNCTIIILDEGKSDNVSNFSINSYSNNNKNCSILFDIHNLKSANYLFSLEDIKDCKEIRFKFNGNVHGQKLFKEDAISSISPDLIINSIKAKMQKFVNMSMKKAKKEIYNKFFFTKLNDNNSNNIGILFSFKGNRDTQNTKNVNRYIMEGKYEVNKIFICIDMWMDNNNILDTKDSSNTSSKISNLYNNNTEENYYYTNNNSYDYQNNSNNYSNKYNEKNNKYNNKYNNKFNNTFINNYNNKYNNNYNGNPIYNNSNINYNNNKYNENKFDNLGEKNSIFYKNNSYENSKTRNNKDTIYSSYNKLPKIENKYDNQNYYNSSTNLRLNHENDDFNKLVYIYEENNVQNYQIDSENYDQNINKEKNPDEENKKINESADKETVKKRIYININNEFIKNIYEKYKQDNCISNYTILRNKIDLNISVDIEKLKNVKLLYFFDCFKDINRLSLDIPFITEKGKLLINEFNPTLSSMRLILKTSKKTAKKIKKNKKKNFIIKTVKPNLLKIEYNEAKAPFERDILYKKVVDIEEIIGDNKIAFKHVLQEKSYFCVLWTNRNNKLINTSFLAYYSFKLKLIGVLMIKINPEPWLSSFSYNIDYYYKDYQTEYDIDEKNIKEYLNNLSLEKGDYCQNFCTDDYIRYILCQKKQTKQS